MKDTYKNHKRIIKEIKNGTYPEQVECEKCEDSETLNYLIDNGYLKGIRDKWGLIIDDISTTELTNLYLEEISRELSIRNPFKKFINLVASSIKNLCIFIAGLLGTIWVTIQIIDWFIKNNK